MPGVPHHAVSVTVVKVSVALGGQVALSAFAAKVPWRTDAHLFPASATREQNQVFVFPPVHVALDVIDCHTLPFQTK